MSSVKMHYAISDAKVGLASVAMFAFRIDHKPNFCPKCGIQITSEEYFGVLRGGSGSE